jgi:glycosyltransferase involved in cell wall biosynthesis
VIISCNYAFDFYWLPFVFPQATKFKEYHSSRYFEHQARLRGGFLKNLKYTINDYIESKFTRLILLNADEKPFYHSDNLEVIPNSIALSTDHEHADLTARRAIAAGRIAPIKGFDTLIGIWEAVAALNKGWRLDIYGQGDAEYIRQLQDIIDRKNLGGCVRINGATNDLKAEMLQSSLYVMTSHTECYPMVLLEAMAVGLPVVSFDCPTGPRNIVSNDINGFLVADQDAAAFSQKIISLVQDESSIKTIGNRSQKSAVQFSNGVVMRKWVSLFDKTAQEN